MVERIWAAEGLELFRGDLTCDIGEPLLSPDEMDRAARYGDPVLRRRFVVRRAMLRQLLGWDGAFQYGELGKPAARGFEFSVSSCGDLAVFLLSSVGPVGVDVERIDPDFEFAGIFEGIESSSEFFWAWTRREAVGKAAGMGIVEEPAGVFEVMSLDVIEGVAIAVAFPDSSTPAPPSRRSEREGF